MYYSRVLPCVLCLVRCKPQQSVFVRQTFKNMSSFQGGYPKHTTPPPPPGFQGQITCSSCSFWDCSCLHLVLYHTARPEGEDRRQQWCRDDSFDRRAPISHSLRAIRHWTTPRAAGKVLDLSATPFSFLRHAAV